MTNTTPAGEKLICPETPPYDQGFIEVSHGHKLHYARFGNPNGKPAVNIHGGPGAGWEPVKHRQFYDLTKWNLLCFSQRGSGQSTPSAESLDGLQNNTTQHLIKDIEALRQHFKIKKWLVQGHSWGSTLGVAYAEAHPEHVSGLIISGIFFMQRAGMLFHYQDGAQHIFPDMRADYENFIPENERHNMVAAYHKRLMTEDAQLTLEASLHWNRWERMCGWMVPPSEKTFREKMPDDMQIRIARIENHYFHNNCFMEDGSLLKNADKLKNIKGIILQGRNDVITPPSGAWALHKAWPQAEFHLIPAANHAIIESETYTRTLIDAIKQFEN